MSSPDLGSRVIGNRYRLLARLGQGGMGTVWKAMDDVLNRTVAIKEIDLPESRDGDRDQLRERTMREARAAARLSHPNAVTVYDVVEEAGRPWIVMQLVAAESLADAVRDRGPLPPGRVAEIGLAVLQALQAAHAAGIVHRDVKPGNVLLGYDGRVVLTDFGIATLEGDPSITGTGMLLGAPAYIAPERARGLRPGPASDLWSLGATLYTAVEGRPPYDRETPLATLTALMTEEPPAPVLAGPLTPILQGLLEPDPAHRLDATTAGRLLSEAARTAAATAPLPPIAEPEQPPVAPAVKVADRTQVIPRPEPALEPVLEPATEPAPPGLSPPISPPPRGGPPGTLGKRRRPLLVMLLAAAALVAVAAALLIANLQQPTSPAAKRSAPTKPSPKAAAPSTGPARPPPVGRRVHRGGCAGRLPEIRRPDRVQCRGADRLAAGAPGRLRRRRQDRLPGPEQLALPAVRVHHLTEGRPGRRLAAPGEGAEQEASRLSAHLHRAGQLPRLPRRRLGLRHRQHPGQGPRLHHRLARLRNIPVRGAVAVERQPAVLPGGGRHLPTRGVTFWRHPVVARCTGPSAMAP